MCPSTLDMISQNPKNKLRDRPVFFFLFLVLKNGLSRGVLGGVCARRECSVRVISPQHPTS